MYSDYITSKYEMSRPAGTQAHRDSYPTTTASHPRCKLYLGDLQPNPVKKLTLAGIKDVTSRPNFYCP